MNETLELVLSLLELSGRVQQIDVVLENLRDTHPQKKDSNKAIKRRKKKKKEKQRHENSTMMIVLFEGMQQRKRIGENLEGGCNCLIHSPNAAAQGFFYGLYIWMTKLWAQMTQPI